MLRLELLEDRCLLSTLAEFPLTSASSSPLGGITTGPDGNIWFTENQASQIGMMNPTTHVVTLYQIPGSGPTGITAGPDGNIWFTESAGNKIGMINLGTHTVTDFAVPTSSSQPSGITAGPDGNIWFTEAGANQIGVFNPGTPNDIQEYLLPTSNNSPAGITAGPDGNLWFTENNSSKIGTISPVTRAVLEYATPSANSQPVGITTGPDGNLWFTENKTNRIAQVKLTTSTPDIIEFPITTSRSGPYGIAAGADGNLWFAEANANQIGSINPTTGVVSETALPTASASASASPSWITTGPGGVLFFTEANADQVGEVIAAPVISANPPSQTVVAGQTVTFTAAAAIGLPTPTAQWQVSTNAGLTFTPLTNGGIYSGVTTGTLTVTGVTTGMSGYEFEAVFSNGVAPPATTAAAILTVNSVLSIMPALPQGTPGANYNQTISVVGGSTAFTLFSVNSFSAGGTGLTYSDITTNSVNGTITMAGKPTAVGSATFTVAVANSAGNTLTQNMTITISPPLSIATAALPAATAGMIYSQAISVIGGAMPYTTFSVTGFNAGTTGLTPSEVATLPAVGAFNIVGMPTGGGTATFTVNIADSAGTTLSKTYTINVNPALVITPSLPQGTAGTNYRQTAAVTGGGVPYTTFTVTGFSGGVTGLTLANLAINPAAATITLSGTPSAAGTVTFTANVADSLGAVLNKTYAIKINPALSITQSLAQGTAGFNYHQNITVLGGATPYTTFAVNGFSAGGTGLTASEFAVNAATGTISLNGTPTGAGTAGFTVNVTDTAGSSLTKAFSITINAAPTISNPTTTQWTAGSAGFTASMTVSGGTTPHAIVSYTGLPTGLTPVLHGTTITFIGTPTVAGAFSNGAIMIQDAVGATVIKRFGITINAAPSIGNLTATQWTTGLPGFNGAIAVSGGTGGLSIVASSTVPAGMLIVLNGNRITFTGTPTTAGTYAGSVTLRDAIGATVTQAFTITINAAPTIGNLTVTQWTAGKAGFTGVMTITPGTAPFTIVSSSGVPTGMTAVVVGNTVRFLGTPTVAQTYAGSITLHDAAGATITKSFSITINPPLSITTTSAPATRMAVLYTTSVHATGGTGAVTYALTAGSLPPGIKLSSNGTITGASRGFGSFTFTITAIDAIGATISKNYTLTLSFR